MKYTLTGLGASDNAEFENNFGIFCQILWLFRANLSIISFIYVYVLLEPEEDSSHFISTLFFYKGFFPIFIGTTEDNISSLICRLSLKTPRRRQMEIFALCWTSLCIVHYNAAIPPPIGNIAWMLFIYIFFRTSVFPDTVPCFARRWKTFLSEINHDFFFSFSSEHRSVVGTSCENYIGGGACEGIICTI